MFIVQLFYSLEKRQEIAEGHAAQSFLGLGMLWAETVLSVTGLDQCPPPRNINCDQDHIIPQV